MPRLMILAVMLWPLKKIVESQILEACTAVESASAEFVGIGTAIRRYHLAMAYAKTGTKQTPPKPSAPPLRLDPNLPEAGDGRPDIRGTELNGSCQKS